MTKGSLFFSFSFYLSFFLFDSMGTTGEGGRRGGGDGEEQTLVTEIMISIKWAMDEFDDMVLLGLQKEILSIANPS